MCREAVAADQGTCTSSRPLEAKAIFECQCLEKPRRHPISPRFPLISNRNRSPAARRQQIEDPIQLSEVAALHQAIRLVQHEVPHLLEALHEPVATVGLAPSIAQITSIIVYTYIASQCI